MENPEDDVSQEPSQRILFIGHGKTKPWRPKRAEHHLYTMVGERAFILSHRAYTENLLCARSYVYTWSTGMNREVTKADSDRRELKNVNTA